MSCQEKPNGDYNDNYSDGDVGSDGGKIVRENKLSA